ncbi:MAG: cytochrome P450 [Akkermansiaceae bacterium]|nr:cytochrome P450 [Akkermansiaceae bacterium]
MTNEELRDEMITLLLAGHETTATALAWTAYHVISDPSILARIRSEVNSVGDAPLSTDRVAQLTFLDAVGQNVDSLLRSDNEV